MRIYLGILEKVPVAVGRKNASIEKIIYESRTFLTEYKSATNPMIPTTNSCTYAKYLRSNGRAVSNIFIYLKIT